MAGARATETISEQEAHAIGVAAYTYFYPLVTMDLTRKQLTNVAKAEGMNAPMNTFASLAAFPPADMKAVVRPNFDTLYSSAWLDLTKEPMIVSVPDTQGRYYLLPMLDMWTDVFASPGLAHHRNPGRRLCLGAAGLERLVAGGRGSHRCAHARMSGSSGAPRPTGRPTMTPCTRSRPATRSRRCRAGARRAEPVVGTVDPGVDMKTPPKVTVDTMPAGKFFAYAAEILKLQPPHITDQPILAQMRRIGIERGKSFDIDKVDPAIKAGLADARPRKP